MRFLSLTDGLIIGAAIAAWIRSEYRWAQAVAEDRERRASRTTPRSAGNNFDNPNRMEWTWPSK